MNKLTKSQQEAINSTNPRILVAASAGTGKTYVMVKRIIKLICENKVPINQMLIVTFAKASAEEMRTRIRLALEENAENDKFVQEQLKLLPLASISTLHSFCSELIKKYFYYLNIPPKYSILDPDRAKLLQLNSIEECFLKHYEENDIEFLRIVEIFAKSRKDEGLAEQILMLYHFSRALENPNDFLNNIAANNIENSEFYYSIIANDFNRISNDYLKYAKHLLIDLNSSSLIKQREILLTIIDKLAKATEIQSPKELIKHLAIMQNFSTTRFVKKNATANDIDANEAFKKLKKEFQLLNTEAAKISNLFDKNNSKQIKTDLQKLVDITQEFAEIYQNKKLKIDSLDYSDLEHYAKELLSSKEIILDIQNQFKYVFVDEYQDTSRIQEALISTISQNNLFMVGDIKQSIYAFRQCDKTIFQEKQLSYNGGENGEVIYLNKNFRSGGKILSFVNEIFSKIMTGTVGDDYINNSMFQDLDSTGSVELALSVNDSIAEDAKPTIYSVMENKDRDDTYLADEKEGLMIVEKINSLVGTPFPNEETDRTIRYSDICILMRAISSPHAKTIIKTLKDNQIPVTISADDGDITQYPEILQVYSFLQILLNYKNDIPLLTVLKSPFFSFSDSELLEIKQSSNSTFFHESFFEAKERLNLENKVNDFFEKISYYRTIAFARGGAYALSRAITETDFEILTLAMPYGDEKISRIKEFLSLVTKLDEEKNLSKLVTSLEKLENNLKISESTSQNDTISCMSIHKSKGLEFPICFISGIHRKFNVNDTRNKLLCDRNFGLAMNYYEIEERKKYESLQKIALAKNKRNTLIEDELRLLYVAMTRAKQVLIMTGSVNEKKDTEINSIRDLSFSEITSSSQLLSTTSYLAMLVGGIKACGPTSAKYTFYRNSNNRKVIAPIDVNLNLFDSIAKSNIENNINYSYPHSIDLTLPTKFAASSLKRDFYVETDTSYIVKNQFMEKSAELGTAYHKLLELSSPKFDFKNLNLLKDELIENEIISKKIANDIDLSIIKNIYDLPIMQTGDLIKEKPFIGYFPANLFTEYNSKEKVLIQGIIDLIIFDRSKNSAILVDYKFSNTKSEKTLRERYSQQLNIYKYAIENILKIKVEKSYIINIKYGIKIEI